MWETIRNLIVTICSVLIGYFSPLGDIVFVIFFVVACFIPVNSCFFLFLTIFIIFI